MKIVNETLGIDEAQDIIIMFYLQDISVQFLEEEHPLEEKRLLAPLGYLEIVCMTIDTFD